MKRSDHTEEKLDPEVERELEAVERALAGLPVDEEMAPIANLVAEIRAERPEPDQDDERRRYYRLTAKGMEVARGEARRLEQLVSTARKRRLLPRGNA